MRYYVTSFLLLVSDQLTKWLVVRHMAEGESIPLIPPLLYITYVQNTGAAFGIMQGRTNLLSLIAIVGIGLVWWQRKKIMQQSAIVKWGIALAIAGAVGNFIDRLFHQAVIDFIDVGFFPPIFNIADIAIVGGVMLLFWEVITND